VPGMSGFESIPALFIDRTTQTPDKEAYRYPVGDDWKSMTWAEAAERVRNIAGGLMSLGIESEQRVGIISSTRLEWILADLGVLCAAGAVTTVYPSNTAEECAYILTDSGTVMIFAEDDEQVDKLREVKAKLPVLEKVIVIDHKKDPDGDWVISLADLEKLGADYNKENPKAFDERVEVPKADDLATLIYTSGTTGKPKGVELLHSCWTYTAEAMKEINILGPDDLQYLWLPLSHSFGKVLEVGQLAVGFPTAVDGRIPKLVDNLAVVRPTFMAAAPRIFEKVYNKIVGGVQEAGGLKLKIFRWSLGVGREVSKVRQQRREPGGLLAIKAAIANKLVFSKIKNRFGGRLRFFISGSAPLSKEIAEFFHAADILILEGYGLTETSAATVVNRPDTFKFGAVGEPLPGTEVKIADEDGEILIKGPGVMRGYHNLPDKTREVLTEDGWLHTGDIGEFDDDGILKITDRKKDLIKTSGGKYVAPQALEGQLKALCPYLSQVIVHGDRRNFCTALITLDEESIQGWAKDHGLDGKPYGEIARSDAANEMVQGYIDKLNSNLARYETIKKFVILEKDLSLEEGDLTPSLKVKRKAVEKKYMNVLDDLYEGAMAQSV
jgi:long-chain acyl-CoA synthetase